MIILTMAQEKKEQILASASECFAKYGYQKTTLEDIGQKIGLSKASIYYYFKNKEEIFTTIILDEFQQFMTKLHDTIEEDMNCEQKIFNYFEQKLRFVQKSMILHQLTDIEPEKLQRLVSSWQEILAKMKKEEKNFMAKILEACIKHGQIKECNVEKVSKYMFSLVDGLEQNFQGSNDPNNPLSEKFDRLIQDVQTALHIFINGLK